MLKAAKERQYLKLISASMAGSEGKHRDEQLAGILAYESLTDFTTL